MRGSEVQILFPAPVHDNLDSFYGEVAERLNAPVLKTGKGASPSRVRIPPSPPYNPWGYESPWLYGWGSSPSEGSIKFAGGEFNAYDAACKAEYMDVRSNPSLSAILGNTLGANSVRILALKIQIIKQTEI